MSAAPLWRWGDPLPPLVELLGRGGILAVPTESSYGLGADPLSTAGVAAVYRLKGREPQKPLPIVISRVEQLVPLGIDPESPEVQRLRQHWPAALSAVLPTARRVPAAAGGGTLAVRMPASRLLRRLLDALGTALTATSANRSGEAPVVAPGEAAALLAGEDAVVVDGGVLPGGPPSTLVAFEAAGVRLLRRGSFPVEEILSGAGERIPEEEKR